MKTANLNGGVTYFTPRTSILGAYLSEISKYRILTPEETLPLIIKAQSGDKSATELLVNSNQRFVFAICKRYANNNNTLLMDLISEANVGLIIGIERFNIKAENTLLTYAVHWIEKHILSYLTFEYPMVKLPNKLKTYKVPEIKNEFSLIHGRLPSNDEILRILKEDFNIEILDESDVYEFMCYSLDYYNGDDDISSIMLDYTYFSETMDETYNENDYEKEIESDHNKSVLNHSIGKLSDRDREVIELIYGIKRDRGYEISEVADKLSLTKEGVRMIRNRSLERMKKELCLR